MKKFFLSLVALFAVAVTSVNAREVVISGNDIFLNDEDGVSFSQDGVTITCDIGYMTPSEWQAAFMVSSDDGRAIKSIRIEYKGQGMFSGTDWDVELCDDNVEWEGYDRLVECTLEAKKIGSICITVSDY